MKLKGKNVFITGANRGIGRELVIQCLNEGAARVYAGTRDPSALLLSSLPIENNRLQTVQLDVTHRASINDAAALANDCHLLINNAGVLSFGDILSATPEEIDQAFAVNFWGVLNVTSALAPALEKNSGALVNVLTLLSLASMPGMAAYNASKAAAWSLTLSLRASLSGRNISVHSVFPGAVDTNMLAGVEMAKTSPEVVAAAIVQGVQEGREDIFPDPMSVSVYQAWCEDHKAVERQFAAM